LRRRCCPFQREKSGRRIYLALPIATHPTPGRPRLSRSATGGSRFVPAVSRSVSACNHASAARIAPSRKRRFHSSCDPFGANPYGDQLFTIRADGKHLRQLTHVRGLVTEPDDTVSSENIGPIGSSSFVAAQ
jgi:hypothetical protein